MYRYVSFSYTWDMRMTEREREREREKQRQEKRLCDCVDYLRLRLQFTVTAMFTCKHLLDCFDGSWMCIHHTPPTITVHQSRALDSREVYTTFNTPYYIFFYVYMRVSVTLSFSSAEWRLSLFFLLFSLWGLYLWSVCVRFKMNSIWKYEQQFA